MIPTWGYLYIRQPTTTIERSIQAHSPLYFDVKPLEYYDFVIVHGGGVYMMLERCLSKLVRFMLNIYFENLY